MRGVLNVLTRSLKSSHHIYEDSVELYMHVYEPRIVCTQQTSTMLGSVHRISWLPWYHLNLLPQLVHLLLDDSCIETEHHQQIHPGPTGSTLSMDPDSRSNLQQYSNNTQGRAERRACLYEIMAYNLGGVIMVHAVYL